MAQLKAFPASTPASEMVRRRRAWKVREGKHVDTYEVVSRDGTRRYRVRFLKEDLEIFCSCPAGTMTDSRSRCWHARLVLRRALREHKQ